MFCKNCGNEIKDGELSCAACGAPAPQAQAQAQQPEKPVAPQQPQYEAPQAPQQPYAVPQQPYMPQQPYVKPARNPMDGFGFSVAGLVLGICGIVFGWIPFVSILVLVCSILGIVFGFMGRKKSVACYGKASGVATAGFVLGIVGASLCAFGLLTCTVCPTVIACEAANEVNDLYDDFDDYYDYYY